MGRRESPEIETIENTLARLIGIRIAVAIVADRAGRKLTQEDWDELNLILNLTNAIQDDYLALRVIVSRTKISAG